jgi:hypothetical protein
MLDVTVVPANEANWDDLQAAFGNSGDPFALLVPAVQLGPDPRIVGHVHVPILTISWT